MYLTDPTDHSKVSCNSLNCSQDMSTSGLIITEMTANDQRFMPTDEHKNDKFYISLQEL